MSTSAAQITFWAFAAVMGLSMASIFLVYTGESIARVFFITAATFGAVSLYGYTTKRDLSGMGSFLFMGLIGIVIASLVNIFLASSALQFAVSVIGVLVFTGLTAWDTQRLKEEYLGGYAARRHRHGGQGCDHGRPQPLPELHQPVHDAAAAVRRPARIGRLTTVQRIDAAARLARGGPLACPAAGACVLRASRSLLCAAAGGLPRLVRRGRRRRSDEVRADPAGDRSRARCRHGSARSSCSAPTSCVAIAPDFGGISGRRLRRRPPPAAERPQPPVRARLADARGWRSHSRCRCSAGARWSTARGQPLDAEALVLAPGGDVLVADEARGQRGPLCRWRRRHRRRRVRRLPGPFASSAATNEGVETLARLPDGSLLAIAEGGWRGEGLHAAVLLTATARWRCAIVAAPDFGPTDAAVAGDWLFVLERRLSLLGGWQARIVTLPLAELPERRRMPSSPVTSSATVAGPVLGENYEAIDAWVDPAGGYRLLLVSDDNFSGLQRTQLLELRWRP